MNIVDFGQIEGPLVLFGGPYSNFQATEALVRAVGDWPAICTGDTVAYCADPLETVALIRAQGWPVVAGNCERQIAEEAEDCGCGFGEGTACDLLSRGWYPHALAASDAEMRAWMAGLPDIGVFTQDGRRYAVLHGGATSINLFLWPTTDDAAFRAEIEAVERLVGPINGVVAGHCGIPFQRRIGSHLWINPGTIGLPPHDGHPETRYAVLDAGEVVMHRLVYDHAKARARMEAVGLTQGYHATLSTGVWPSEDILPTALRRPLSA